MSVLIGFLVGVIWGISPGTLCITALTAAISWIVWVKGHPAERSFLLTLFLGGFFLRVFLSLFLDGVAWFVTEGPIFSLEHLSERNAVVAHDLTRNYLGMGDSDFYSTRAFGIARYAQGATDIHAAGAMFKDWLYGWSGHLYIIGLFYALCGYSPITVKWLNCLLGALIGLLVYGLARDGFNRPIARSAAVCVSFFPSLIFWSATNLKDILFIVLALWMIRLFHKLQQPTSIAQKLGMFTCLTLAWLAHITLRSAVYSVLLLGCLVISYLLTRRKIWIRSCVVVALLCVAFFARDSIEQALQDAIFRHAGHILTPGDSYRYLPEIFYRYRTGLITWGVFGWVAKAVFLFLSVPFPWKVSNLLEVLVVPQQLMWYPCLPFAIYGIFVSLRWAYRYSLSLILISATWTIAAALTGGNIGTAFRTRDMVSPILLLFTCVGAWVFYHGTQYFRSSLALNVRQEIEKTSCTQDPIRPSSIIEEPSMTHSPG